MICQIITFGTKYYPDYGHTKIILVQRVCKKKKIK